MWNMIYTNKIHTHTHTHKDGWPSRRGAEIGQGQAALVHPGPGLPSKSARKAQAVPAPQTWSKQLMFWEHLQQQHRSPAVGVAPVLLWDAPIILKRLGREQEMRDEIIDGITSLFHALCRHLTRAYYVNRHLLQGTGNTKLYVGRK